jgi:signal transduction histidine kinase
MAAKTLDTSGPASMVSTAGGWDDGTIALGLDELPDGVLVTTLDGRVEAANSAFLSLIGRGVSDVLGQRVESLVAEQDMLRIVGFQAMFGDQITRDNNLIFEKPDGEHLSLIMCSIRPRVENRVILTARASGTVQEALADTSRWAAAEQARSLELSKARDALAVKNAALSAAQAELEKAYATLQTETSMRQRLENELNLAQRLESIGQLAAGIAHEINTPMQYIGDNVSFLASTFRNISSYLGSVNAALAGPEGEWAAAREQLVAAQKKLKVQFLAAEVPKALEASQHGVEHVSKIVLAMKSFAHVDQDDKMQADINRTLSDTLTVAQNEYKNIARVETDFGDLPSVLCFAGKLNQVFLNLIVNAAQAIEDAKKPGLGLIRVVSRAQDGYVEVRVADDGSGIPEAIQHRVFDQFFTTKEVGRGSGQGLSLARRIIVDGHGGSISFETTVGAGTTFIVRVPVDGTSLNRGSLPLRSAAPRGGRT